MIRIKFEVEEEEEEVTPIENENEQIKRLFSLKSVSNNNNSNNFGGGSTTSDINNVFGTLKEPPLKLPENNVVPKKVVPKKKKKPKLDNSKTDSVAFDSRFIKTEPAESLLLSLTTQLNNSLNIQSLLRQNRIQNGWTTNEQSIPIGTQQQQQSLILPKIEPIVSENHQKVQSSLDQSLFLIPNLNLYSLANSNNDNVSGTTEVVAAAPEAAVPLLVGKKPLPLRVPPLTLLEEKKARKRERDRLRYHQKKANLKSLNSEVIAEKLRRKRENRQKHRQQLLANGTPEQLELIRGKDSEARRRQRKNETEERRQQRLERGRQYDRTMRKQRLEQKRKTITPEERDKKRVYHREYYHRYRKKKNLENQMES